MAPRAAARPLILVVDDGRQHVTLLRLALMQRGYAVVVVHSAEGARTMIREKPVDAVLVTLSLAAAAEILRDFGEARPHVAITFAPPGDDGAERARAAGFDIALARPIDFAELDASLRERMKKRASGTRASVRGGARAARNGGAGGGRGGREGAA
jgi:DNA-binding response OmpR family regulator